MALRRLLRSRFAARHRLQLTFYVTLRLLTSTRRIQFWKGNSRWILVLLLSILSPHVTLTLDWENLRLNL